MPTKKLQAAAQAYVPQSKDACAADIRTLGDLQRDQARVQAYMNDRIAAITAEAQPLLEALQTHIDRLFRGIHAWCEAHRAEITDGLRAKTANLVTGSVSWRTNPPSCRVRGEDNVIAALKALSLADYVRTTEAVNKEAVIATTQAARTISAEEAAADPAKARTLSDARALTAVAGLTVVTGVEVFAVLPFEQEVAA